MLKNHFPQSFEWELKVFTILFHSCQENFGLKTLDLSMNGFDVLGAEGIGKAIKQNRTLRCLDISNNRIPQDGAKHVAKGLAENDGLQILRVIIFNTAY